MVSTAARVTLPLQQPPLVAALVLLAVHAVAVRAQDVPEAELPPVEPVATQEWQLLGQFD